MTNTTDAIHTDNLGKRYGKRTVVENVSLRVPRGTFYAFLGPNGAGKSTVIRCLTGLIAPSEGRATVAGCDVSSDPVTLKARIGIVSEDIALYEKLGAGEFLEWAGQMRGLTRSESARRTAELLTLLDLSADADRLIAEYSLGMKKKTALAFALLHAPAVLFLDEPFNGVDALSVRTLCAVLTELTRNRGITVFFTSHVLETVERLADRAAVIRNGAIIAEGNLSELMTNASGASLEETFAALIGATAKPDLSPKSLDWF
ncbi:MAG: ABC transporter ATP-binding protein [Fibrella sp.]|nr:ABC transporter ATP-binding protein [Armatimonadota bacterium]